MKSYRLMEHVLCQGRHSKTGESEVPLKVNVTEQTNIEPAAPIWSSEQGSGVGKPFHITHSLENDQICNTIILQI